MATEIQVGMGKVLDCPASERFGPHGGNQVHVKAYYRCGCDAGYCGWHSRANPGLPYSLGQPEKCKKHRAESK